MMRALGLYILLTLCCLTVNAQRSGISWPHGYYINAPLAVARGNGVHADTAAALLHIGPDTSRKGMIIPRGIIENVANPTGQKGLFFYNYPDSVLWHLDGTKKARYFIDRDTFRVLATYRYVTAAIAALSYEVPLTFSTGLTRSTNTITNNLSTGIGSANQSAIGSTLSGGTLTLSSTSHATKGKILFGTSAYDEVNNRLGIGTASPQFAIEITKNTDGIERALVNNTNTGINSASWLQVANGTQSALIGSSSFNNRSYLYSLQGTLVIGTDLSVNSGGTSAMLFATGGFNASQEKMRLLSNGRLLIGTATDAGELLQAGGTFRFTNSSVVTRLSASGELIHNGKVFLGGATANGFDDYIFLGKFLVSATGSSHGVRLHIAQGTNVTNRPVVQISEPTIVNAYIAPANNFNGSLNGLAITNDGIMSGAPYTDGVRLAAGSFTVLKTSGSLSDPQLKFKPETGGIHTFSNGNNANSGSVVFDNVGMIIANNSIRDGRVASYHYTSASTTATISDGQNWLQFTGSSPQTWTLAAARESATLIVKNTGSATVTLSGPIYTNSLQASIDVLPGEAVFMIGDGTKWNLISKQ